MPRRNDDDYEDDDRPVRRRSRGYLCPFCRTDVAPVFRSKINALGWITIILGTPFCLLGLIGLAMRSDIRVCPACNGKV